jgi:hypothetical protein
MRDILLARINQSFNIVEAGSLLKILSNFMHCLFHIVQVGFLTHQLLYFVEEFRRIRFGR